MEEKIDSFLKVQEVFYPSAGTMEKAWIKDYDKAYAESIKDMPGFWEKAARELEWFSPWTQVLQWDYPWAKWFVGATCNITHNCLDRHLKTWRKNKVALIWVGEDNAERVFSYAELYRKVCRCANALKALGVRKGDRVAIYLPKIPEQTVAMLACARIGAIHTVVYSGFSAPALASRIEDSQPRVILTADGGYDRGKVVPRKPVVDDPGWVTEHSYIVYGPLLNGATILMAEGKPDYPTPGRWWDLIERYGVTIFYTTPTAIRLLMKYGEEWPKKYDLRSLRILGSVGEPINPEAWLWFHRVTGGKLPIMDTWWQTETGAILVTPLPCTKLKPGSAARPFLGIEADVVDREGNSLPPNIGGFAVIKKPWPSMLRTIYKDPDRYKVYWNTIPGCYTAGDVCRKDEDGYFFFMGRADDVIKVAGNRIGTAEVESALVSHPAVAEAAVIGKPHKTAGESIKAFLILQQGFKESSELIQQLKEHVKHELGKIAVPQEIEIVPSLPKTRSGKIMRRVLKAKELGQNPGDISTLED